MRHPSEFNLLLISVCNSSTFELTHIFNRLIVYHTAVTFPRKSVDDI